MNQLGDLREKSIEAILPVAPVHHKILTLDPSALAQLFDEAFLSASQARRGSQVADPNRSRRLRLSRKAKGKEHSAKEAKHGAHSAKG
jgi:hypothetical protein